MKTLISKFERQFYNGFACVANTCYVRIIILTFLSLTACSDFISIDPPKNQIVSETVFQDDQTAISAIKGIYSEMIFTNGFADGGGSSVAVLTGMSADELVAYSSSPDYFGFFANDLQAQNSIVLGSLWSPAYRYIFYANTILEGLKNSKQSLTNTTINQLEGEAKFIRAFCHFYLANLFGDVPLILTPDYRETALASRTPIEEVYKQIVLDLRDAQALLSTDYSASNGERIRPNSSAATALLARVFLFQGNWQQAEEETSKVIDNTSLFNLGLDLNSVFLKDSPETIWQLKPVDPSLNTREGNFFVLQSTPNNASLSNELLDSFESNDLRFNSWVGSYDDGTAIYYFPFKYKISSGNEPFEEYSIVLRLAELYLIRAEARAELDNLSGSIDDINKIRDRAGLELITESETTKMKLLSVIYHEKQIELFSEWGHRWFDLKRTQQANEILAPLKTDWSETDVLYPIPQSEIDNNGNLKPQNSGY